MHGLRLDRNELGLWIARNAAFATTLGAVDLSRLGTPPEAEATITYVIEHCYPLVEPDFNPAPRVNREVTPAELRARKEAEASPLDLHELDDLDLARHHRVYLSVDGARWICCHNLIDDDHSPWCQRYVDAGLFSY